MAYAQGQTWLEDAAEPEKEGDSHQCKQNRQSNDCDA